MNKAQLAYAWKQYTNTSNIRMWLSMSSTKLTRSTQAVAKPPKGCFTVYVVATLQVSIVVQPVVHTS